MLRPSIKSLELIVSPDDLQRKPPARFCQLTKNELIQQCMKKNFHEKRRYLHKSPSQKRYQNFKKFYSKIGKGILSDEETIPEDIEEETPADKYGSKEPLRLAKSYKL